MGTKMMGIIVLALVALVGTGCSSTSTRVYYLGDKAYAKKPETEKIMSWEYKVAEGSGFEEYDDGSGLGYVVTDVLNCIVN